MWQLSIRLCESKSYLWPAPLSLLSSTLPPRLHTLRSLFFQVLAQASPAPRPLLHHLPRLPFSPSLFPVRSASRPLIPVSRPASRNHFTSSFPCPSKGSLLPTSYPASILTHDTPSFSFPSPPWKRTWFLGFRMARLRRQAATLSVTARRGPALRRATRGGIPPASRTASWF